MNSLVARSLHALGVTALLLGAVVGITLSQPHLARTVHLVKERDDVYPFPPPNELRIATLGYRSAAVDLLWAKLLIEYGTHWQEKRVFPDCVHYLDSLIALEPTYRPTYHYGETMLFYHPGGPATAADAEAARRYLERGVHELPNDADLWFQYGQFLAFTATSVMPSSDRERLRSEGATAIARSAELKGDADRSLAVAGMLNSASERAAKITSLQNAYALTEDEDQRKQIALQLDQLEASAQQDAQHEFNDRARHEIDRVDALWKRELPFVSHTEYLLLAPLIDPVACAGLGDAKARPECARSWPEVLAPTVR